MSRRPASDKIGQRLHQVRQEAGLSQRALAARIGVMNTTVGYIEQGRHSPAVELVERLAEALGVTPSWLAFGVGPMRDTEDGMDVGPADPLLDRFASIQTWRSGPESAPHKPLLLLITLAQLQRGEPRLAKYEDVETELRKLIKDFGTKARARPEYPFWRLQSDGFWEVAGAERVPRDDREDRNSEKDPTPQMLRAAGVAGGLKEDVHQRLQREPALVVRLAKLLLEQHFPASQRAALIQALGLRDVS